jgi:hypothetical protein
LKRIALFILILLFLLSSTTFAQGETTYKVGGYFTVAFPADWEVYKHTPKSEILVGTLYKMPIIDIKALPIQQQSLDDLMSTIQNAFLKDPHAKIEDIGSLYLDNRDTRWILVLPDNVDLYYLMYFAYSDKYRYDISFTGEYHNLATDRKTIDAILASIKILK